MRQWKWKWSIIPALLFSGFLLTACGGGGGGGGGGDTDGSTADTTPPTVTATPAGGTYDAPVSVSLEADETATIYYTTDGTTPTTSSSVYEEPISISAETTLRFFAVDDAGNQSTVESEQYAFQIPLTVSGQILLDTGGPAVGATVSVSLTDEAAREAVRAAKRAVWAREDYTRRGAKEAAPAARPLGRIALRRFGTQTATTDDQGNYELTVTTDTLPIYVLVEIQYEPEGLPAVDSSRWVEVTETGSVAVPTVTVPDPTGAEAAISGTEAETADGSVEFADLPTGIDRIFARVFDPGDQSGDEPGEQAFPGEFAEMGSIPLESSGFLWVEALDADGNPVSELSQAVRIRALIPRSQWGDLEDITQGTDRIELPMYFFNEDTQMWEQGDEPGWLEAADGTVLPEDAQSSILDGTYDQDVYASFTANHFSWMNVDYAYIGPWTLSRLDRNKRNVDCLYNALQLAKAIVRSAKGHEVYAKFNKEGGDLDVELADAAGPEIKNGELDGAYGEFKGNEQGDRDDQLYFDNSLWDGCGDDATEEQKKNTTLLMAVTLVHETAHWKWDVKHDDGNWRNREPGGEAGNELERDLFGGIVEGGPSGLTVDGNPLSDAVRDRWLNTDNWPPPERGGEGRLVAQTENDQEESPIQITLALDKDTYDLGENILATVTYENISDTEVSILTLNKLEGYPLSFEILREGESVRVPFIGIRAKRKVDRENDFVMLQPGETYEATVGLLVDPDTGNRHYNLIQSGNYQVTAFYSPHWGIPETSSAPVSFTVLSGGSVAGTVTHAVTGDPVEGATVSAIQDGQVLASAVTDATGQYRIPELPGGTYDFEARAPGFLRTSAEDVAVTVGDETQQNFSLTPLLTAGEVRIVLTWGEQPYDLDSHLWLPPTVPYHVYYSRRGSLESCPNAGLDVDDTSSYGPETITITQRVTGGNYVYYVYNYSGSPDLAGSGATVEVFDSSGRIATFTVPETGTGRYWHVFNMDGDTGSINEINEITDTDPRPYLDTSVGCGSEPPSVSFETATQTVGEGEATATVTITLDRTWPIDITVPVSVAGTATEGDAEDFTLDVSGSVTIPAENTTATITVTINDDTAVEGDETVVLTLGAPDVGTLGAVTQHTLTITDND